MDYQVIVVGAGPAGATAAYHLAGEGIEVLLLDKATFPRYKPCGGGVSPRALRLLFDFDCQPLIENVVNQVTFSCNRRDPFAVKLDEPLVYLVDRCRFDAFLVERAAAAGAQVIQGCEVNGIDTEDRAVVVQAGSRSWRAAYLVGADGAASRVRRCLGLPGQRAAAVTLEALVPGGMACWPESSIWIDYGFLPWGYGWVFPKVDHSSIGVGYFRSRPRVLTGPLQDYFRSFCEYAMGEWPAGRNIRPQGWSIPVGQRRQVWQKDRVLLVGDAAGLADPFTGEGICAAVQSGQSAAATLLEAVRHGPSRLAGYSQAVQEEVLAELLWAQVVQRIFYPLVGYFHNYFLAHPDVCRAALNVIYGRLTYREWVQRYAAHASWKRLVRRSISSVRFR